MNAHIDFAAVVRSAPLPLAELLNQAKLRALGEGFNAADAEDVALRRAQHAGWYQAESGWSQLGPDLRGKVEVRKAHRQPDGRYLVRGVPIFYPNAVKMVAGRPVSFDAEAVRQAVDNTNRASQLPSLTPYHVLPEHKLVGATVPTLGKGFNFAVDPIRPGWMTCDMRDVEPDTVARWRDGQISGFSPAFVQDAGGTNRRIGHVAMLGAEAPALSHLPTVELFSSAEAVCFSATPYGHHHKGPNVMKLNKEQLKPHLDALNSAYAAMAAGEPDAEHKFHQAHCNYTAAIGAGAAPAVEPAGGPGAGGAPGTAAPAEETGKTEPGPIDPMYSATDLEDPSFAAKFGEAFAANPQGAFVGLVGLLGTVRGENKALREQLAKSSRDTARQDFAAWLTGDDVKVHNFDAAGAMTMYDATAGDPKLVDGLKRFILTTPLRAAGPADVGPVFDATTAGPDAPNKKQPEKKPTAPAPTTLDFSATDPETVKYNQFAARVAVGNKSYEF